MTTELPAAVAAGRRSWLPWMLPVAALLVVVGLLFWQQRRNGRLISIAFPAAHGLRPGAALQFRGMEVGEVSALRPSADGVAVDVRLRHDAAFIARAGSQFWIVRPEVDLTAISGLDTIIGARYIAVRPGAGVPQSRFVGVAQRPVVPDWLAEGPGFVLVASDRGGLQVGAPVLYRQCRVGLVTGVELARDASAVEIRCRVAPNYAGLVQQDSRWWRQGGVRLQAGWGGVSASIDSLAAVLRGGIAFASPAADRPAPAGSRFRLAAEADEEWLTWEPSLSIGAAPLVARAPLVTPVQLAWRSGSWWTSNHRRSGYWLATPAGSLAPADLIEPLAAEEAELHCDGESVSPPAVTPEIVQPGLALVPGYRPAPMPGGLRAAETPEDVIVGLAPGRLIAATRMTASPAGWTIAVAELGLDPTWHGAPVLADADGALVGLLVIDDEGARVLPLTATTVARLVMAPAP